MKSWYSVRSGLLALFLSSAMAAGAGPIQLVKDINRSIELGSQSAAPAGSKWVLPLCVKSFHCMPWVTDGTPEGTRALMRVEGSVFSVRNFTAAQGTTFFESPVPGSEFDGERVWRTDGTPEGTVLAAPNVPTDYFTKPVALGGSQVFVSAQRQLWITDSTPSGTLQLAASVSSYWPLVTVGSAVYFLREAAGNAYQIWKTDGTAAGTQMVRDMGSITLPVYPAAVGDRLVFSNDQSVWASDGTEAGTAQITNLGGYGATRRIAFAGGVAYFLFRANDITPTQLWRTDGTAAGTAAVVTLPGSSEPENLNAAGSLLYFPMVVPGGRQVWRSDGTAAGTFRVNAVSPSGGFLAVGAAMYFTSYAGDGSTLVWRSEGTEASTTEQPFLHGLSPRIAMGSSLLLWGGNAWISDTTAAGTRPMLVAPGEPSLPSSCDLFETRTVTLGDTVFFPANDGEHGCALWKSDGTAEGTVLVKDVVPGRWNVLGPLAVMGGHVYFVAGTQLWKTDGTEAGTVLVKDYALEAIPHSGDPGNIHEIAAAGTNLFISAVGKLWRSSGVPGDAVSLPRDQLVHPEYLTVAGNFVYFRTYSFGRNVLWRSDGTLGGTIELLDGVELGEKSLVPAGNKVFFIHYTGDTGNEPWVTDGTPAGTRRVIDLNPGPNTGITWIVGAVGDRIVFSGSGAFFAETWATDGTPAGTVSLGSMAPDPASAVVGNTLYFTTSLGELYATDGTPQGTRLAVPHDPLCCSVLPLGGIEGSVFFLGMDSAHGMELWVTPGTGAALVEDFVPGEDGLSHTTPFRMLPGRAFLLAGSKVFGEEPHVVTLDAASDPLVFESQVGVPPNAVAISNPARVLGISQPAPVNASNGEFCVSSTNSCSCDIAGYSTSGSVALGQYLCVRHVAAPVAGTAVTTTLNVGGGVATFTTTAGSAGTTAISATASTYSVDERGSQTVIVERQGSASGAVSVQWNTSSGSAIAGEDFGISGNSAERGGVLTWLAGDATPRSIVVGGAKSSVPLIIGAGHEPDEHFTIVLSNPTGGAVLGAVSTIGIRIVDHDSTVEFHDDNIAVGESGANAVLRVVRRGGLDNSASVTWQAESGTALAGSDFGTLGSSTAPQGTIVFVPGEYQKLISIGPVPAPAPHVPVIADGIAEAEEKFAIRLNAASAGVAIGERAVAQVTLDSPDSAVAMAAPSVEVPERQLSFAQIRVDRLGAPGQAVSVNYATVNGTALAGTHYVGTSGTLTWDGYDLDPRFIAVQLMDDAIANPTRYFTVTLSNPVGIPLGAAATRVNILDDDNFVQFASATATVNEGAALTVTLTRSGSASGPATVYLWTFSGTATSGNDYSERSFYPIHWAAKDLAPKQVVIGTVDDALPEGDETFQLSLNFPYGTRIGPVGTMNVTIKDNDTGVSFSQPTYAVSEAARTAALQVQRVGPATAAGSVRWTAADGTGRAGQDFGTRGSALAPSGVLSWTAGDAAPKTISIPILQDLESEGPETFTIALSAPSTGMVLGTPSTATVTINDDDIPAESAISFESSKVLVFENAGNATLTVRRQPTGGGFTVPATVSYATTPGTALATSDYTTRTGTLTWAAGDGADKVITIPLVNNTVAETHEAFKVTLSTTSPGARVETPEATVTIVDDDESFPRFGAVPDGWTVPVGAAAGWHASNDPGAYEGVFSLRSDSIDDDQAAQVEVTRAFAAGNITFRVKVSSEAGFDQLRFFIDDDEKGAWSGTTVAGWQLFSVPVTAGTHTLRWSYKKDSSASIGQDAAWIDAVVLP